MIVLSPLGLLLPNQFKAGEAWGEWPVETVKEQTGIEPAGMKRNAGIYKAPVPDYNFGKEDAPIARLSVHYILSGFIGTGIIFILTVLSLRLFSNQKIRK